MERYLLTTLLSVIICFNATSRDVVTKLAQNYETNNPALFWTNLGYQHPEIKAMRKAIEQKKPAMQIVAQALGDMSSLRYSARSLASNNVKHMELINLMYEITGIKVVYSDVEFFVIGNNEMNACMYPEGTCIINTGLIENASNIEEVVGVVAHEIAHFVLWHTMNDAWRTAKAVRRNQTWAEIGTGLAMGAYAASQINNAQYGVQQSNQAQQQMYNNLINAGLRIREEIGLRTDIFTRLRYMRETESEADETAFWFLEKNGIDPIHLINFFKRFDSLTPSYLKERKNNTKYSDHPDMANRIETLELMYKKYHKPIANQKLLPALSSFRPTLSSNTEAIYGMPEIDKESLYVDKTGKVHSKQTCYSLKFNEFDKIIKVESLTEKPTFCGCVPDDLKQDIRINLSNTEFMTTNLSNNVKTSSKITE